VSDPTDEAPPPSVTVDPAVDHAIAEAGPTPRAEELAYPNPPTAPAPGEMLSYPSAPPPADVLADAATPPPADEVILPPAADLQDAVGAPSRRRRQPEPGSDDDGPTPPRNRRVQVIAGLSLVAGLGIVALVFLGRANSQRYLLACSTDRVTPEQGRSFPPWGSRPLAGPEWKPVALPPNAECTEHETDNPAELERLYLDMLVDRASTTLTGKNLLDRPAGSGAQAPLDAVSEQLTQALLLARSPERRDQRKEVERLMGDVTYWRATGRLRDASAALLDAAKQFEAAAAQRPRHVSDADAWGSFLRRLSEELKAGPGGVPTTTVPTQVAPSEPRAPMGSALPVEPPPAEGSAEAPAPPDAGVPSGGVLL